MKYLFADHPALCFVDGRDRITRSGSDVLSFIGENYIYPNERLAH